MQDQDFSAYDPRKVLAQEFERQVESAKSSIRAAARARKNFAEGRKLTAGELREIQWMFGPMPGIERARVLSRNFWWPFPNDRAMVPYGSIYFPHQEFREDFFQPGVSMDSRSLFMHEATHLYQWYVLKTWVWVVGPLDRNYDYVLEPGRPLREYGLEQMGNIVRDYFLLRQGYRLPTMRYRLPAYADVLPVRR